MVFAAVLAERKYNVQRFNLVYSALYSCSLFKKIRGMEADFTTNVTAVIYRDIFPNFMFQ